VEKKLQNLKHSMDNSIFSEKRFTEKNQLRVIEAIREKDGRNNSFWNMRKSLKFGSLAFTVLTCFILSIVFALPGVATLFESSKLERPADENYLIVDGYYYVPTNESIEESSLSDKLGEVTRNGYWNKLKEGDTGDGSNYHVGEGYYKINNYPNLEYIAIEVFDPKVKEGKGAVIRYDVLKREKPIEQINDQNILGAKNDPEEVKIALNNIKEKVPFTHELQTDKLNPTLVSLDNDGEHYKITLYYQSVGNKNSTLFIKQYQSGFKEESPNQSKTAKSFEVNGINWSEYEDGTFKGVKDNIIFEIKGQEMSADEVKSYLPLFKN
jgi:hypothetical protein